MRIAPAAAADKDAWLALRLALWPDHTADDLRAPQDAMLADTNQVVLIARDSDQLVGFAEAALRRDYVNGCETSPVTFLEGIYVAPTHRRRGVARALVDAVAAWGRAKGCTEFASDALLSNTDSHAMHRALGFAETERVVYFRKRL